MIYVATAGSCRTLLMNNWFGYLIITIQWVKWRIENEPRLTVPSCHGK